MAVMDIMQPWVSAVRNEIAEAFSSNLDAANGMYNMMQYHLGWRDESLQMLPVLGGGKYLRPMLCLISHHTVCDSIEKALPLAASIELQHNSTLILDDVEDGDEIRRGRPTVWKLFGVPQGVNTGDAMSDLALKVLWKLKNHGVSSDILLEIVKESIAIALEIREGQYMDISFETRLDVSTEEYLCMIGKKTGALIELSTYGGAFLANQNALVSEPFREFGRRLGIAMQIRDDLVGIWGEGSESGKFKAADLRKKKKTLPVIFAMEQITGKRKEQMIGIYKSPGVMRDAEIALMLELLDEKGAYEFCYKIAKDNEFALEGIVKKTSLAKSKYENLLEFASISCDSIGKLSNYMAVTKAKRC